MDNDKRIGGWNEEKQSELDSERNDAMEKFVKTIKNNSNGKGRIGSSVEEFFAQDSLEEYNVCIVFSPVHSDVKVKASSKEEAIKKVKEILGDHIEEINPEDVWQLTHSKE
jgi:hypothetical protein